MHSVQLYAALFLLCLRSSDPSAVRGGDDLPLMAFDLEMMRAAYWTLSPQVVCGINGST